MPDLTARKHNVMRKTFCAIGKHRGLSSWSEIFSRSVRCSAVRSGMGI
jgi:hypothetical protein